MQERVFFGKSVIKYRENVAQELTEERFNEVVLSKDGPKDASLVGKLVEELDQAKKIYLKLGLSLDYLTMTQNLTSRGSWKRSVQNFFYFKGC